jgi:hypothetical protein
VTLTSVPAGSLDSSRRLKHHVAMELIWAATLWGLWSSWLLAQHLGAPAGITRASAGLFVAELVALAVHSFDCGQGGCGPGGRVAGTAAGVDVPLLAVVLVALAIGRAWRRAERAAASAPRR